MGISFFKGFEKNHHLKLDSSGNLEVTKNSRSCCCSKTRVREVQEDTLAIANVAEKFKQNQFSSAETLQLYTAIKQKQKRVNAHISGFINWIKAIFFRSKTYNKELKLLRSKLQEFNTLFSQQKLVEGISAKHLTPPSGTVVDDKNVYAQLKKELPNLFTQKSSFTPKDFEKAKIPFLIRQTKSGYEVGLAPCNQKAQPTVIALQRLDQLPEIHIRLQTQALFAAVKSQSSIIDSSTEASCRQAIGKVHLNYAEDLSNCTKNELIITYYKPLTGTVQKNVNLNTLKSQEELQTILDTCKNESLEDARKIDASHTLITGFIEGKNNTTGKNWRQSLNLTCEISFQGKEFVISTQRVPIQSFSFPWTLTLDELIAQLETKLEQSYSLGNPHLINYETIMANFGPSSNPPYLDKEKLAVKVRLRERQIWVYYCNLPNNAKEYKCSIFDTNLDKASDSTQINSCIAAILKERHEKKALTPPLFNLTLDAHHPLNQPMEIRPLLNDTYSVRSDAEVESAIQQFGKNFLLNHDLLAIPLSIWMPLQKNPTSSTADDLYQFYHPIAHLIDRARHVLVANRDTSSYIPFIKCMERRIQELDQTIQFTQRLNQLKEETRSAPQLELRDLIEAWDKNWNLKFALMGKEELLSVKISDLHALELTDQEALGISHTLYHFFYISQATFKDDVNDVKELRLVDIPHLKAKHINNFHTQLPLLVFQMMSLDEIPNIVLPNLSDPQLMVLSTRVSAHQASYNQSFEAIKSHLNTRPDLMAKLAPDLQQKLK